MAEMRGEDSAHATAGAERKTLLVVPRQFKRNSPDVLAIAPSADTGLWLLQYMCERIGIPDLAGMDVLDFGCGSRFAEAITTHEIPLRSYVGIDVYKEMIDFLNQNVRDSRLSFHRIDAYNPRYNEGGVPLTAETRLPVGDTKFDVVCMFSVITHQLPEDARSIFAILRRYVKQSGHLFFSAWLDGGDFGYREDDPDNPTDFSVYSLDLLTALLESEEWRVISVVPKNPHDLPILDSFLCAPV
jgi:SAM-dependent methyltransferase